jgi:hypothetical protein
MAANPRRQIRRSTFPPDTKAQSYERYPSLKPGIWGAVFGAAAISVIGFSSFGWMLGGTAERMANERAQTAVVGVLTPICVERFQHQADAATKLIEFKKVSSSWDRRSFIEKGGWATMPGTDAPNSAVVTACAERLGGAL